MEPKKFNQHIREIISTWREAKKRFMEGGFTNKVNDEFMETKMIKAPFDVEMAKKITNKEIPGRIVTRDGRNVRIICWNAKSDRSIIALIDYKEHEDLGFYTPDGHIFSYGEGTADLFMEIPDHQEHPKSERIKKRDKLMDEETKNYINSKYLSGPRGSFRKGFCSGWDACLKHLSTMTREQAINEIKDYCKGKEG